MDEKAYIFGTDAQKLDETKEVKVRLPVGLLIKLHGLKLIKSQNISDTVAVALEQYFAGGERAAAEAQAQAVNTA